MSTPRPRLDGYQKRLLVFLGIATFFEGYDFFALTQILPNLRHDMGLSRGEASLLVSVINIGSVLAYFLVRYADRWGRRRLLTITIAGYTAFTFLTGLAPNALFFVVCQLVARVFLLAEWAISMMYAAEEYPAERRGMAIGVISALSSLGGVVCAGVVPFLLQTPYGWRSVYLVGIVPLILLALARRNLRETRRFTENAGAAQRRPLMHIWHTPHRKRLVQMALIWGLYYVCSTTVVFFWKDFAVTERGLTDAQVGRSVAIAAVVSMPLVFAAGPLLDLIGRKRGAVLIFGFAALGAFGSYTLHQPWPLTAALMLAIAGNSAALPVLNAFTAELFPTEMRGDAFAWANNLLGRVSYVLAPTVVGAMAETAGWGPAVSATALCPVLAAVAIFALLPETRARELEETAAVDARY